MGGKLQRLQSVDLKTQFNKKISISLFFIFSLLQSNSIAVGTGDILKYMDANYPRQSIYKANYKMAKAKWYSLNDHLSINPKFLMLVEQPLRLNGEETKYKFIYNSGHNFFSLVRKDEKGGRSTIPGLPINIFQKKIMEAPKIDDEDMTINQFVEKVFDHCRFTNMISAKDPDKKSLNMSNYGSCYVTQINTIKFKSFTEEDYKKNNKEISKFAINKDQFNKIFFSTKKEIKDKVTNINNDLISKQLKNSVVDKKEKTADTKKEKIVDTKKEKNEIFDITKKNYLLALSWNRLDDLIVGKINFENKSSGKINIKLNKSGDICIGLVALTSSIGTWSLTCPNNDKRFGVFKKNLSASGTLLINKDFEILGNGKDIFNNRINFAANFIN